VTADAPLTALVVQLPFPTKEEFLRRHGANLTAGGLFVRTPNVKPPGSAAVVEARLQGGERILYAQVRVEFVSGQGGKGIPGMGLRFTHVDAETQRFLDKVAAHYLHARNPLPPVPPHVGPVTWAEPLPAPVAEPAAPPAEEPPTPAQPEVATSAAEPLAVVPAAAAPDAPSLPAAADEPTPVASSEAAGVKGFFKKLFGG